MLSFIEEKGLISLLGELNSFYIPSFQITDILEILILIFVIYKVITGLRNTRAMVLLKGVLILFIFYNIAYMLSFNAILVLFDSLIALLLFGIIVVFAPEMRKFLEQIGTQNISGKINLKGLFVKKNEPLKYYSDKTISELSKAVFAMGEVKTGALIVLGREFVLTDYIATGIDINADISSQLLINIFEKNTPLHDGAVIQVGDKIVAATCYLPLSENKNISKHLGTRHRAAIGMTENSDCIVIIVSEETGNVSLAINGHINYNLTKEKLTELLTRYQTCKKENSEVVKEKSKKTVKELVLNFFADLGKTEDFSVKFVSVVVAVVGWFLLMNISNPIITRTIEDVPIEFINTSVIEATGKTFELVSDETVTVKVTERRSIVDTIKKEDVVVIADLTKLSYVNAVTLTGAVEKYPSVTVDFVSDDTVILELDSIISKEFNIELDKYISEDSKTYVPVLDTELETIVISGGKSLVETIGKVVFTYDVSNIEGTYSGTAEPTVYDKNGDIIDNKYLTFNIETLKATGQAYDIKVIPLELNISKNSKIDGYSVSSMEYTPKNVKVAGNESYMESINKLVINMDLNINSENISNNQYIKTLKISENLPEGVYFADSVDELNVTLNFEEYKTKTISFMKEDVIFKGVNEEYSVSLQDSAFKVTISGEDSILEKINNATIIPYIDVSGLTEGNYNLIMQFEGLDNVILTSNISVKLKIESIE